MALTESEVKQETTGLDRDFVLAVISLQVRVDAITDVTAESMGQKVMDYATATGIKDQDSLVSALLELLTAYFLLLNDTILKGQVDVAKAKVKTGQENIVALRKAKAYDEARKLVTELNGFPTYVQKTFAFRDSGPDNLNYERRIKSIQDGAEKTVRNIIANGMDSGQSALQISKKIQQYIAPDSSGSRTRPFDEYRKRFNTEATPNIRRGSVKSNALMIARTETAEMYRNATEKLYGKKKWIKGYRWVLSNSHPHHDICDDLAGNNPYPKDGTRPFSHPHCVCDWQAERYTDSELAAMVKNGDIE